jgi:hypothetical protein
VIKGNWGLRADIMKFAEYQNPNNSQVTAKFMLPPFQAFVLPVLSISIAVIWSVGAKDGSFHFGAVCGVSG